MLLVGLLFLISALQPHTIAQSMQALTSPIQRRYVSGENNPILMLLRWFFQLCTMALTLAVAVTAWKKNTMEITWQTYWWSVGTMLVVMLGKGVIDRWIQLTFQYAINAKTYYKYRNELWMVMSVCMLLMLIISPWLSSSAQWIIPVVVMGLYYILLFWKLMQVFGWDIEHILYTLLYMAHAEVLPVMVVVVIGDR